MWVVERPDSKVFLFGETVGVRSEDVWLTDPIRAAFDDSREFWCEVADAQDIVRSPLLGEYGLSAEPLSSRLEDRDLRYLEETARVVAVEPGTLEGLRPWLAGELLEHAHRFHAGVDTAVGVHEVLVRRARDAGKVVRAEFPDANSVLASFGNLDEAVEIDYLMWTVDRVAQRGAEIGRQVEAWMRGDGSVVEAQVAELQSRYPRLSQWLLVDRNRAWVPRIADMLKEPGSVFVLVGDSHMPGDDGLPALLARSGLQPRRVV